MVDAASTPTSDTIAEHDAPRLDDRAAHHASGCLVVMYHYVQDSEPIAGGTAPRDLRPTHALSRSAFISQIDMLCREMEPIDWPTLYASLAGHKTLPERCFLLTFDDGLADHARTVVPILQELRLRGVFFVPGCALASQRLLPAHAVHLLLSMMDEQTLEREILATLAERTELRPEWTTALDVSAAEAMYHYESPARARVKYLLTVALPIAARNDAVDALFKAHIGSANRWARHWYLGWEDLADMQAYGHTVGGHGFSHEPYGRLSPLDRRQDMARVATVLRNGFGPDVRPFSFPYGQFDDDTCAACRDAGFAHAFTTQPRWVAPGSDPWKLPRIDTIDVAAEIGQEAVCRQA